LPLSLTSLLLTLALSLSASPTQRGGVEASDVVQSLDALRIELGNDAGQATRLSPHGESDGPHQIRRHDDDRGRQAHIEAHGGRGYV
jgi:hypothetical protein